MTALTKKSDNPWSSPQRFNDTMVERLPVPDKQVLIKDTVQSGLYLRMGKSGKRVFYISYVNPEGVRKLAPLGSTAKLNVKRARAEASDVLKMVGAGRCYATEQTSKRNQKVFTLGMFVQDPQMPLNRNGEVIAFSQALCINQCLKQFLFTPLPELTEAKMNRWRRARLNAGKTKPQTLNRQRAALVAVMNKFVENGIIEVNPLRSWKPLPVVKQIHHKSFTQAEEARLLVALDGHDVPPHFSAIVKVALWSGCRRNEIFSLVWKNVILDKGDERIELLAIKTKSKRSRVIPLNGTLINLFNELRPETINPDDLIFPSPRTGKQLTTIKTAWRTLIRRADIQGKSFHSCRHTFCSRLIARGASLATVKELAGHASITTTEIYLSVESAEKRSAVNLLG